MFAFIINSALRDEVMSPSGGIEGRRAVKRRSHLERLMEGPERPRPAVTDWGKFVTGGRPPLLSAITINLGSFIHRVEE